MSLSENTKTISEAVDEYMGLINDFESSHRSMFMIRGKWVWKDIRSNVLRSVSHKWVPVNKTKAPYRVNLPGCVSIFHGVSVRNNGLMVDLTANPYIQTVDYVTVDTYDCGCPVGVNDCITTNETTTEEVIIEGDSYTKTTVTTILSNGDVYKEITTPIAKLDSVGNFVDVVLTTSKELVCNLETKECGCVAVTQENLETIKTCCSPITVNGFYLFCTSYEQYKPLLNNTNSQGYFKYDEDSKIVYLHGTIPDQVLVHYISTGQAEEDELIPDYAMMAFFDGMEYMNSKYSQTMKRLDKREVTVAYNQAKRDLETRLPRNLIRIEDWINSTNGFAKW